MNHETKNSRTNLNLPGKNVYPRTRNHIRNIIIIVLVGLITRFAALPFSMTIEADAVSRVFTASHWLSKPEIITHGAWGPLHFYLIAAALWIWNNLVWSPVLLHILFSVATGILLYLFVKHEWDESSGLFVAIVFLFYPVALHNSLMAVSETPFLFFVVLSLLALASAREETGTWVHALTAGLSLTMAAALRYEAWVLIPFLAIPLYKKRGLLFVFILSSSLFPIFWMLGNYLHYGDALYGPHLAHYWQVNIEGVNENLSMAQMLHRVTYFPRVLFSGFMPPLAIMCLAGITRCLINRKRQSIWLVPVIGLLGVFMIKVVDGSLLLRPRYSLILGGLILPFAADIFSKIRNIRLRIATVFIIIIPMISLSIIEIVPRWSIAARILNPVPPKIEAIPRFTKQKKSLSDRLVKYTKTDKKGLILDFFGWDTTYYVALASHRDPKKIFIMPGGKHQKLDLQNIKTFLDNNRTGIILAAEKSRYMRIESTPKKQVVTFTGLEHSIDLKRGSDYDGIRFYHYKVEE